MSQWIFTNPETGLPYHPRILSWWVPAICRAADVPPIQPKDMRATCATLLLNEGRPLPEVSRLLGHASIATTSAFYARIVRYREDQIAGLADGLDAALDCSRDAARVGAPIPMRGEGGS
jgi:integrase